jgi:hypothetical protein
LSEDGIVMGIQHRTLPFAAVQFHPESILTSPAHGMKILENALTFLKYSDGNEKKPSGAELVGKFEKLSIEELREALENAGLASRGSKSELVVRLTLYTHKSTEAKAGRINFSEMSDEDLSELKQGLGLKSDASSRAELMEALERTLVAKDTMAP